MVVLEVLVVPAHFPSCRCFCSGFVNDKLKQKGQSYVAIIKKGFWQTDWYNRSTCSGNHHYLSYTMLSFYYRSLLLSFVLVSATSAYDCLVGCYWNSDNDVTVCGEDKNVYPNECFAICQNVTIIKIGSCDDDIKTESAGIRKSQNSTNSDSNGVLIPMKKIQQHDGYKLLRKYNDGELQGKVHMPVINEEMMAMLKSQKSSSKKKTNSRAKKITPLMLDSEGYEYIGTAAVTEHLTKQGVKMDALRSVPGYNPDHDANNTTDKNHVRSRQLPVFGRDTRKKITKTTAFPYSAVGAMGYNPDEWICTGTVISRSAVLTAAHCVYDRSTQQWTKVTYFAPGRGDNGQDWNDPYGSWPVKTITVPQQYSKASENTQWDYDYAVVMLSPNSKGQYIGDVVGHVGLDEVSGFDDTDLDHSTITGYPGDKGGRTMWTMGKCSGGFVSGASLGFDTNFITLDKCDTTPGTSGSALMRLKGVVNNDYSARGVNIFGTTDPVNFPWNGANFFKQGNGIYDAVYSWSGH